MAKHEVPSFTDMAALAKVEADPKEPSAPDIIKAAPIPAVVAMQDLPPPDPEAPPVNMFSGVMPKLAVYGRPGTDPMKPIPGHELYWFTDENGGLQISNAIASGWRFVDKEEIALNEALTSPGNSDTGSRVRRWVGSGANNTPEFNYLMKIPDWLYKKHMAERERIHQQQEEQLAMGTYKVDDTEHTYTAGRAPGAAPGARSGLPSIKIGRYYRPPST